MRTPKGDARRGCTISCNVPSALTMAGAPRKGTTGQRRPHTEYVSIKKISGVATFEMRNASTTLLRHLTPVSRRAWIEQGEGGNVEKCAVYQPTRANPATPGAR